MSRTAASCEVPLAAPRDPVHAWRVSIARAAGLFWLEAASLARTCSRFSILVDVSHLNEQGFWDLAATTSAPIVATQQRPRTVPGDQEPDQRSTRTTSGNKISYTLPATAPAPEPACQRVAAPGQHARVTGPPAFFSCPW